MTIRARDVHRRWMEDPEYAKAYEEAGPRMALAFQMAEARDRAGLNQAQLAGTIGSTQTQVSRWERGRAAPTADRLIRYAHAARAQVMLVPEELVEEVARIIRDKVGRRPPRGASLRLVKVQTAETHGVMAPAAPAPRRRSARAPATA